MRAALEGLTVTSVKGPIVMRACDHQAEQPGFVVKVAKKPGLEHPVPEVIATYTPQQVTPACKQMEYSD